MDRAHLTSASGDYITTSIATGCGVPNDVSQKSAMRRKFVVQPAGAIVGLSRVPVHLGPVFDLHLRYQPVQQLPACAFGPL